MIELKLAKAAAKVHAKIVELGLKSMRKRINRVHKRVDAVQASSAKMHSVALDLIAHANKTEREYNVLAVKQVMQINTAMNELENQLEDKE